MDSSRVSTFFISILLIVYGSFRSLAMEEGRGEDGVDEKDRRENNVTTLDSVQAMCLPLGASVSLLIMFFFFDSMQVINNVFTEVRVSPRTNRQRNKETNRQTNKQTN